MTEIDWTWIQSEFDRIASELKGWRLIGEDEYERLKLSRLTYGLIDAQEWRERSFGTAIYVARLGDGIVRDMAVGLALELGLVISPSMLPPKFLRSKIERVDHFAVVQSALDDRHVSQEFLLSWSRLQILYAQRELLICLPETESGLVENKLVGAQGSTEIQRYWFAFWIKTNARSLSVFDREEAGRELADICKDVISSKLMPWGPYPIDWYGRLLDEEQGDLRNEYYKLGIKKLETLTKSPYVTPAVLPPLSRAGFSPADPGGARVQRKR
ncbi:hypothetical protein NVS89_17370 [Ancylobacter sp. MQZ15Z-1]|uniref:Uncharacterized protein n=1 Tax=Ancylobacter mangrovi TaxID=2972472 RepID=A0A9X2PDR2_9HYPH|nr:hypothetical protein [Ancylobacter mangrovi]MCS0496872.1 hypothetical protein [Ancylobacter mangrovi]